MGRTLLNLIACQLASGSGRFAAIMKSGLALSLVFVANVLVGDEILVNPSITELMATIAAQ